MPFMPSPPTYAGSKCFRCGAPATTHVDYFPLGVELRRFLTCWPCSDALAEMGSDNRQLEFERAR